MKQQVKRKEKLGIFFWLAVIALAVIIVLVNRDNISNTLEQSDIREALNNRVQSADTAKEPHNAPDRQISENESNNKDSDIAQDSIVTPLVDALISDSSATAVLDTIETINDTIEESGAQTAIDSDSGSAEQQEPSIETRQAHIYFVKVNATGHITPQLVARTVPKTSAPLTQSIHTLLQGLTSDEIELGLLHLIPPQTELLSASIQDGVAVLNFTEHFRYNGYGEEGMIAQMLQVVYSVTQFNTIDAVQILIEGEPVDFLNSDSSIYLGRPINRDSITLG